MQRNEKVQKSKENKSINNNCPKKPTFGLCKQRLSISFLTYVKTLEEIMYEEIMEAVKGMKRIFYQKQNINKSRNYFKRTKYKFQD